MPQEALGLIMLGIGMLSIAAIGAEAIARAILWVHGRTSKLVLRKQS